LPVRAAQGPQSRWPGVLHQPHLGQGARPRRERARLRAVPLVRAAAPGDRPRHGHPAVAGRERAVLPLPPTRLPPRRVGEQAVVVDRVPGRAGGHLREPRTALAGGNRSAYAGLLGRLSPGAGDRGVLAGTAQPAARPAALPPGRGTLAGGTTLAPTPQSPPPAPQ